MTPPAAGKKRAPAWNGKSYRRTVLEREGWILFEDVERHLAFGHVTYDFLRFGDLQLFHPERGWVLENVCVKQDLAEHVASALANPLLAEKWLRFAWVAKPKGWQRGDVLAGDEYTDIPFAARVVAYPDKKHRAAGDFTPRIVPIVLGADGQLRALDYP